MTTRAQTGALAAEAPVLEVIGAGVGHVVLTRAAADLIAPPGNPILPALVTLVAAHRAAGTAQREHAYGTATLRVVRAREGALVVGLAADGAAAWRRDG